MRKRAKRSACTRTRCPRDWRAPATRSRRRCEDDLDLAETGALRGLSGKQPMTTDPTFEPTDEQLADLARLADGTLPAERRAEVEAQVAGSPELARMLANQTVARDAVR